MKEGVPDLDDKERTNLEHELSDVLIYLLRLSQLCHIDLAQSVSEQFKLNELKFPANGTKVQPNGTKAESDNESSRDKPQQ